VAHSQQAAKGNGSWSLNSNIRTRVLGWWDGVLWTHPNNGFSGTRGPFSGNARYEHTIGPPTPNGHFESGTSTEGKTLKRYWASANGEKPRIGREISQNGGRRGGGQQKGNNNGKGGEAGVRKMLTFCHSRGEGNPRQDLGHFGKISELTRNLDPFFGGGGAGPREKKTIGVAQRISR